MLIRDARDEDAAAIAVIYNDAVLHTRAIWNDATVDADNRVRWIASRRRLGYPVLVALDDAGEVVGYASFGDWRAFDGYRHTVENSVYVRADQRGGGIGTSLMGVLIERARACGKHVMIAAIEAGNAGSIRLHERLGFARTGTMRQVGAKFGEWLDLEFMALTLDDRETPDAPPPGRSDETLG